MVEIFSIRDLNWRMANPLPSPIVEGTAVQLDNTFLILGGASDKLSDLIYKYHADKNQSGLPMLSFNLEPDQLLL